MESLVAESVVRLPQVQTIGFAGYGPMADPAACRARVDEFLTCRKTTPGHVLCAICSLAGEAQPIFAESCIELAIPLRVFLPLPRHGFLKSLTDRDQVRLGRILDSAISIEVVGSDDSLAEGEYECSLQAVQQSQELLAIWDGSPSNGLAGTAQIMEFARQMRRAVFWIHSRTAVLQSVYEPGNANQGPEQELDFLNGLPGIGVSLDDKRSASPAESWLTKLDHNAASVAPEVRKLAAFPIVCTALAAFFSATAQGRKAFGLWVISGAVFGLVASFMPMLLRLGPRQALWVRIRTAAEVTRSIVALWATPARYKIVGPEILPELSGMIASLDLLKSQALLTSKVSLADFKRHYVKARLLDQMDYFSRQSAQAFATSRKYRFVGKMCSISAILLSASILAAHVLLKTKLASSTTSGLELAAAALFQFATIAGALLIVKDCDRRQRRYLELHRALADWEAELRAFHTWPPVIEVVSKIERALLVELLEWRSLLQNMKMPRN